MANPTPIANVSSVQGKVFVKGENGTLRLLKAGDPVFEGDVLITSEGARLELATGQGSPLVLQGNETVLVDADVAGGFRPDASDSALLSARADVDRVLKAINEGGSLDELLEETAAGNAAGGTDGGPTFVRLLRIVENVDPLNFEFGTARRGVPDDIIFGGGDDNALPPAVVADDVNTIDPGQATVRERGLLSPADSSETVTGTITVRVAGGLTSITVGGTTLTSDQLAGLAGTPQSINTGEGTLTLTGYDAATGRLAYSYTLNGPVDQPGATATTDSIAITVTSPGGTASTSLDILIVDSVPVAQPDSRTISEDTVPNTLSGNVFDNDDIGADVTANPVTSTGGTIALSYGSFQLNADGSYTYTLNNANPAVNALKTGQTLTETYTYTITDADGDASTATLTITINGNTDGVPSIVPVDGNGAVTGQATVNEQGLTSGGDTSETTTGSITVSAPDGLASVVIGGVTFTAAQLGSPAYLAANPINTGTGTLTLTVFDPVTGALSYSYTLNGPVNQPAAAATTDPITLTINDLGGDSATGTLTINILDTAPLAIADANAITEDAAPNPVSGNVITTGAGSDTLGADATTVTGVAAGTPASASGNVGGAGVAGSYGTLVLNADGSYTYTLNNANPAVNALKTGQTLTETYTYTITDADGDPSTATLTITINGNTDGVPSIVPVDGNGGATGQATVNEQGLTSGGDTSETTTGTITVSAPDGLSSVVIGGVTFTATQLGTPAYLAANPINTGTGTLTLTGFNPATGALSYSYTLNGPVNQPAAAATTDPITLTINDLGGDSATGTLTINILDTAPLAIADANAITEDAAPNPVSGNVITTGAGSDTLGADATTVTGVAAGTPASASGNVGGAGVAGNYGTLVLNADGSYTYTLNNANPAVQALNAGQTTTDVFTYTITDADGDTSTTTLTVTLTGSNDLVTVTVPDANGVTPGDLSVREDLTTTGSFTLSAPDGLDPVAAVTIAGTAISKAALEGSGSVPVTINTPQGVLTVTGYNPVTGVVSYSYDPSGTTKNHTGGDVLDAISIVVRDDSGDTSSSTLTINILDTAPLAIADANAITEDAAPNPVSGNVITTGAGSDTLGADATTVTGVAAGTPASASGNVGGAGVAGNYGTLVLNADGSYTYTLNNANPAVQALNAGQTTTDVFTYTITDADGDPSTTTLTVTLTGSNDLITVTVPDANGVTPGDLSVREDLTTTGSFTLSAPDGLDPSEAVQIAGTWISKAALEASGTTNIAITTPQGVLTVTGYSPLTGVVSYSYDPSGSAKNHTGGDVLDTISIVVKDDSGDTASSNLVINILDTTPVANPDVNAVTEDTAPNPVSGNVITGTGADTLGADATTVTGVAAGTPASASGNVGGAGVAGNYGTLVLNADGSYTYTLNNANPAVQALNAGQTTTDVFTYTITDADGDPSTTTLTVTLTGSNDLITVTVPDANGVTPGDLSVREDLTTTGSFTLSAPDGLDPSEAVQIAGTWISKAALEASGTTNIAITTPQGVLTVTGYSPLTGVVSYSYDPSGSAKNHTGGDVLDTISIVVKDDSGDTASSNLVINILDTAPVANPDVNAVTEDTAPNPVSGNVITGTGADTLGADATTVTGVAAGTPASASGNVGGAGVAGTYGTLILNADGSYTYTLNNANPAVQALARNQAVSDTFTYTITDADGDPSTTTLTVTVTGTNDAPDITVVGTDRAAAGLTETNAGLSTNGTLSIFDIDTQNTVTVSKDNTVTVGGTYAGPRPTDAQLIAMFTASGGEPSTTLQSNPHGINWGFNSGSEAFNSLPAGQTLVLTYTVRATDTDGASDTQNVTITITGTNDAPRAVANTASVTEDAADQSGLNDGNALTTRVGGNVLTNDTDVDFGDTRNVTGVAAGTPPSASGNVGASVTGIYGSVTIAADGSYVYSLNNALPAVQALARGQSVFDTFTYTITDSQGATSTTTLRVTVGGTNDRPDITVGLGDRDAASLAETNSGLSTTGTLSIFDIDTQNTVTASKDNTVTVAGTYLGPRPTDAQLIAMFTASGGEPSTILQSNPSGISWTFNSGSQAFDFLPAGQTLVLTYTVRARDSSGVVATRDDTQLVTITITGTNDGVVINNDSQTIAENATGAALGGNVLANDTLDPDHNEVTLVTGFQVDSNNDGIAENYAPGALVTITTASGTLGVFTLAANGAYTFTPHNANYSGPVPVITYTAGSSTNSGSATLTLTVVPVSDAPGVTRDTATVVTNEDTSVALGLNAPTVTDASDQTGLAPGDNPERLGLITLTGIPNGAQLLYGAASFSANGGAVTILLSDAGNLIASPGAATLTMTRAQFEALRVVPPANSGTNFTVTMSVTSFEVNDTGAPLATVPGAVSSIGVLVDVRAVTDAIDLKINGSDAPYNATINEDTALNLTPLLTAAFQDLDGSEHRDIVIGNPPGNGTIYVNGTAVTAGTSFTILWNATNNNLETSQSGFPPISIQGAANFSGDLNGITVTLRAQDTDADSPTATPAVVTDIVRLNLHVDPVAGDVTIAPVSTPEDTGVRFLNALALTDTDGSEAITGVTVNAVPAGWVIRDEGGIVVFTGNGATAYTVPAGGDFRNYTITPAAHSSADVTISLAVTTTDTLGGTTVTGVANLTQTITVTAVAERIGTDSNADGTPDLTMNANFNYTTAGAEDQWFALATDGFDFRTPWTNQDADGSERTFALLTPVLSGGLAIGSQFQYTLGGVTTTLTYTGTPLQIPMDALGTVLFRAAPNVAGSFQIQVEALTIDTDPNGGTPVQAISGSATLTNLVIAPVADPVTLAVNAPAVGLEDNAIPLVIRPTSADPSETFNVKISGIPADAVIRYNGNVQTVIVDPMTGERFVMISDFSSSVPLTITPPLNSNADIPLSVSAVAVDTSGGLSSVSGATTLPLLVDVRGVADPVTITVQSPLLTTEATVDGNSRRIALSGALTSVTAVDNDGSESVTLVVSGVPSGVNIEGLSFMGGVGLNRIWTGTPAQIATANLVLRDANYSGTINFTVRAVSTENDGNSLSGAPLPFSVQVAPSPEAVMVAQTTVLEDVRTPANFALQLPLADGNETVHSVWINQADLTGKPFSLFLGTTPLASAGVLDGGWYKLTAAQAANVFIQGAANSDADSSFAIKYEVRDPSNDGSLPPTIAQFDATHTVVVNAVTDPTVSTDNYDDSRVISTTTTLEVKVTVTQQDDAAAGGAKDIDGSERLLYFIIDNVPVGVSVEGGRYIGNTPGNTNTGRWILDTPDTPFNAAALEQTIRFALDGTSTQLSNLNQSISIIAHTQDTGGVEQTSTTTWTLRTTPGFVDSEPVPGIPAATITQWAQDPVPAGMAEDAPTPLTAFVDASITGSSPYSVTITGLPVGSVVAGMLPTTIGGQTVWTAQGSGGNASLQVLLAGITITPPPNWNDNQGPFSFSTTLTTYDQGGGRNDASLTVTPPVTPVSDAIDLITSAVGAGEDAAASISLTLSNPEDGAASQVLGGKVYISVNESGMTANGGVLSVGGVPLVQAIDPAGLPPGTYYVVNGVSSVSALNLSYQGAPNASGTVAYTAYVQGQETGAGNVTTSSISGSFAIEPANDGALVTARPVISNEDHPIPVAISVSLADASETIYSVTLTNIPTNFLVYVGGVLASNLGGGVWGIPVVNNTLPTNVEIMPTRNWSGAFTPGVQVWSGEAGLDPVLTTTNFNVLVNGVADGISLTPTLSFGNEGQIVALNLNSAMRDHDGSETATLSFKGLGEYATFYASSTPLTASYVVATDTYTLSGLTPAQVISLGVSQQDGHYDLTVTAFTTDSPGTSVSTPVSAALSLDIAPIVSSPADDNLIGTAGSDRLIGGAGNDTLTGGLGADVFAWKFGDQGSPGTPAVDRITDFDTLVNGDKLDLRDLLQGENHASGTGNLVNFLHFEKAGSNTIVHVSSSGAFSSGYSASNENQTIILQNVDLSAGGLNTDQLIIQDLLNKGKLQTD